MTEARVRKEKVRKAGRVVKFLSWVLVAAAVILLGLVVVVQGYQLQKLTGVAADTKRNSDRLVDCTTPGGKCFEQSRSATSGAVGSINRVTVAAIYCSGKLGPTATIDAINHCVATQIK
jgi:hypothetical protein